MRAASLVLLNVALLATPSALAQPQVPAGSAITLTGCVDRADQAQGATGVVDTDTLEFGFDGQLYGANSVDGTNADLYRYNLTTGVATDLGNSDVAGLNGLVAIPEPCNLLWPCLLLKIARRRRRRAPMFRIQC